METGPPLSRPGPDTEGALAGFVGQWEPTLHLDAVMALKGGAAFALGPGGEMESEQLCTQEVELTLENLAMQPDR